ncbi:hypothetical protein K1T71_000517 [Dendrolimus kikuchii]|uniref:Uncharacterized protein n=1 Tax=Dendrolimus kikuchii TaxID=765133 RepID=A0ACC1DJE4_9NEOP|nr:hypothetical protein K1T71_000517 [Dendrolimus kikuchii]
METKCRVCLCGDRRLHAISNSGFQKIWEILTKTKFNVNDGRPPNVCYICYAQLRNTHQLMQRSRKAEELITVVVDSCIPEKSQQVILKISETKEVSKEKNKRNNDINIKETEEDIICQAETRNNVDKSGRFLVDKLPEKELRIVLDKIDMGTHMRKRTLNEAHVRKVHL